MTSSPASDVSDVSKSAYLDEIIYLLPSTDPASTDSRIVFSLAALASLPESISDDELFEDLLDRCTAWVGEEGEKSYILVILASEGEVKRTSRGSGFWLWRWRRIPRSFRKNLGRMYIVQPTRFTRTILQVVLPFLSPKAYSKIYPLESILLLHRIYGVSLVGIRITVPLLQDESRMMADRPDLFPSAQKRRYPQPSVPTGGWISGFRDAIEAAAEYLPYWSTTAIASSEIAPSSNGCYGQTPEGLMQAFGGVPPAMEQLRDVILSECSRTEGIFRGTPSASLRPPLIALLSLPSESQPIYPWTEIADCDPLLPPKLLMRVFSSAPSPYIQSDVYPIIRKITRASEIPSLLFPALSASHIALLSHTMRTFSLLSDRESATRMTARNYAICFAPDLIRGDDPIEDLEMCLEPGRTLPPALAAQRKRVPTTGEGDSSLVAVLEMWIEDVEVVEGNAKP